MSLTLAAYRACHCTDVQADRANIPDRCPCHHGVLLGTTVVSDDATTGHSCTLAKGRMR